MRLTQYNWVAMQRERASSGMLDIIVKRRRTSNIAKLDEMAAEICLILPATAVPCSRFCCTRRFRLKDCTHCLLWEMLPANQHLGYVLGLCKAILVDVGPSYRLHVCNDLADTITTESPITKSEEREPKPLLKILSAPQLMFDKLQVFPSVI